MTAAAKHFLLFYEVVPDYLERRGAFRDAHLHHAWAAVERGELVLGGALTDPADAAILLFRAASREIVEAFARADPYVVNGIVESFRVREWATVVGELAISPTRPAR